jgi:crotonobetainyl-CoA:carnitine CoA-transferase CaiB-like acyl-CoA transferase
MGPLAGLKVIDLTHVMAGPTCTLMLADMGADVIKIEKIPGGDDTRRSVPPTIGDEAAAFMMMNRNKRGIALDLKTAGGRRVLARLLADADVVVENYRPGTMAKLGFDYEALRKRNPGLIYCALSGFGRTGPYGHRGGFDLVAQAMSGMCRPGRSMTSSRCRPTPRSRRARWWSRSSTPRSARSRRSVSRSSSPIPPARC